MIGNIHKNSNFFNVVILQLFYSPSKRYEFYTRVTKISFLARQTFQYCLFFFDVPKIHSPPIKELWSPTRHNGCKMSACTLSSYIQTNSFCFDGYYYHHHFFFPTDNKRFFILCLLVMVTIWILKLQIKQKTIWIFSSILVLVFLNS